MKNIAVFAHQLFPHVFSFPISALSKFRDLIGSLSIHPSTRQLIAILKELPKDRQLEAEIVSGYLKIKVF
jgi:hypothetical protein